MREKPGHFENVRQEAIFHAKLDGVEDPLELESIGKKAVRETIEKIGAESDERYIKFIRPYKRVRVLKKNPLEEALEDAYDGIDRWETFHPSMELMDLPVQIKSGWDDVEDFRHHPAYIKRHGIFVVLNCGPSVTQELFDRQHHNEILRIGVIISVMGIPFDPKVDTSWFKT